MTLTSSLHTHLPMLASTYVLPHTKQQKAGMHTVPSAYISVCDCVAGVGHILRHPQPLITLFTVC